MAALKRQKDHGLVVRKKQKEKRVKAKQKERNIETAAHYEWTADTLVYMFCIFFYDIFTVDLNSKNKQKTQNKNKIAPFCLT